MVKKFKPASSFRLTTAVPWVAAFIVVGVVTLFITHAATSSASLEPEQGSVNGALIGSDANASNHQYVQFKVNGGGGGTAGTGGTDTSCVFLKADQPLQQAFCDGFDVAENGGTQTGDLDPQLWGVSRMGIINVSSTSYLNSIIPSHNACSGGTQIWEPQDVRICSGQMAESLNDGHGVVNLDTYPKQPFDWAARTGTVVFDLSMNSDGTHGAWPEFIITDEPVPGARFSVSGGVPAHAVNEVGLTFDGCGGGCIGRVYLSKNGHYTLAANSADLSGDEIDSTAVLVNDGSVREANPTPSAGMALNHVEVRISQNALEVWASDPGGANFKKIAHVTNLGLPSTFTKGLVWLSDTHYNARKSIEPCECGTQYDHTFIWDNLGFDGPKTYRDLGYDVPYATTRGGSDGNGGSVDGSVIGYRLGSGSTLSWNLPNVTWKQTPTKAKVVLNVVTYDDNSSLTVSLNGHAGVTKPISSWTDHAISFDLPTTDAVQGTNALKFSSNSGTMLITNMSLILVAGASVP